MRGALSQEAALRVLFEVPVKQSYVCLAVVLAASVACQKPAACSQRPGREGAAEDFAGTTDRGRRRADARGHQDDRR